VVVIAALIGLLFCLHHRKRSQPPSLPDVDHEPKYPLSREGTTVHSYNFSPPISDNAILDYNTPPVAAAHVPPLQFTPLTAGAIERARTPPPHEPEPEPEPATTTHPSEKYKPRPPRALSSMGSIVSGSGPAVSLTDEQVDFIRGLGSANVPPEDIARVIARMKADYGNGRVAGTVPPGYE